MMAIPGIRSLLVNRRCSRQLAVWHLPHLGRCSSTASPVGRHSRNRSEQGVFREGM